MVIVALQATTQATGNKKAYKHYAYRLLKWSRRESNPRPNKQLQCFLHA